MNKIGKTNHAKFHSKRIKFKETKNKKQMTVVMFF